MSETLYLIAHKVSGQPAFDVAIQLEGVNDDGDIIWIIPTSGHRAYPFHAEPLEKDLDRYVEAMPHNLPDHYPTSASPDKPKLNLAGLLPKPAPIRRRV